jgi:hypothetical protein
MPYHLVWLRGMEVCASGDGNDRCPVLGESLLVPNNHARLESWKVEAGRLLPKKANLDLDHLGTSSCQPGHCKPGRSAIYCVTAVATCISK